MDNKEMAGKLHSLAQLDHDAVRAYGQAIERIDVREIRDQLSRFRDDHERHVLELSEKIQELGEARPEFKTDLKGFLIEGMTAVESLVGTTGALIAMQTNEMLTNARYREAAALDLRPDVKALVEKNYSDEQSHLEYVKDALKNRP